MEHKLILNKHIEKYLAIYSKLFTVKPTLKNLYTIMIIIYMLNSL